jgi:hypothetical protein
MSAFRPSLPPGSTRRLRSRASWIRRLIWLAAWVTSTQRVPGHVVSSACLISALPSGRRTRRSSPGRCRLGCAGPALRRDLAGPHHRPSGLGRLHRPSPGCWLATDPTGPGPAGPPPGSASRPGRHDYAAVPVRHRGSTGHPAPARPDRPVDLPAVWAAVVRPRHRAAAGMSCRRRRPARLPAMLLVLAYAQHLGPTMTP